MREKQEKSIISYWFFEPDYRGYPWNKDQDKPKTIKYPY